MFIDVNSITINSVSMGQYLVEAKYGYNKLWSSDAGRNLAGTMSGTLKGIFPKLILQFRKLNKTEFETIVPILDSARQTITYYDPNKKTNVTMTAYASDYEISNKKIIDENNKIESFSCSFISVSKRA